MAKVLLTGGLCRIAGGEREVVVEAGNVRELLRALDARFPGFAQACEQNMSIAIDGDIIQEPLLEPIEPDSEIHFLPSISGG